jgi:2-polyprenyl-3-methyl-5-hydroxy-6-metoxy-1,4-benzoquinol methylase
MGGDLYNRSLLEFLQQGESRVAARWSEVKLSGKYVLDYGSSGGSFNFERASRVAIVEGRDISGMDRTLQPGNSRLGNDLDICYARRCMLELAESVAALIKR